MIRLHFKKLTVGQTKYQVTEGEPASIFWSGSELFTKKG